MRAYELMIILDGDLEDEATEAGVQRIIGSIEAAGATIATTDRWGKRRFAYEIDHKQEGYYILFELTGEDIALDTLERQLRLADDVVRHKVIRLPDREAERRGLLGSSSAVTASAKE